MEELKERAFKQLEYAKKNCGNDVSYLLATYHMIAELFPELYLEYDLAAEVSELLDL